jgi:hypothetical protein
MHEVIGWIGALLYIIAYFLISIKKLQGRSSSLPTIKYFGRRVPDREFAASVRLSQCFYEWSLGGNRNFCDLLKQKKINDQQSILRRVKLSSACTTFSFNMVTKRCFAFFTAKPDCIAFAQPLAPSL